MEGRVEVAKVYLYDALLEGESGVAFRLTFRQSRFI